MWREARKGVMVFYARPAGTGDQGREEVWQEVTAEASNQASEQANKQPPILSVSILFAVVTPSPAPSAKVVIIIIYRACFKLLTCTQSHRSELREHFKHGRGAAGRPGQAVSVRPGGRH